MSCNHVCCMAYMFDTDLLFLPPTPFFPGVTLHFDIWWTSMKKWSKNVCVYIRKVVNDWTFNLYDSRAPQISLPADVSCCGLCQHPPQKKLVYIHREMIERKRLVDVVRCPNGQRLAMTSNCNLRLPCR